MKLKVAEIIVEERKRAIDKKKLLAIADSMKEIGQLHAIKVTPDKKLRAGLHRLEAAKYLGWEEIEGDIVDLDPLRQELIEIDENLMRAELDFLERGEFLRRRKEIYEILYPEARKGGDRKSEEYKARQEPRKPGFARDAADKMNLTARSIHQDIQIAEKLAPELKPLVRKAHFPKADILHLIRTHRPKQQVEILKKVEDGQAATIQEAERLVEKERTIERGRATEPIEDADLKLGQATELFAGVEKETIKLILSSLQFADNIDMALLLSESERVLMPGGILALAMIQTDIEKLCLLPRSENLKLLWVVADTLSAIDHDKRPEGMRSSWLPIVIFIKGAWVSQISSDIIQRGINQLRKGEDSMVQLITRFSSLGDLVFDPYCTIKFESYLAASAGRKYLGFFKSQADIDYAKSRIKEVGDAIAFG